MEQIKELIAWFKNISIETIIDIGIGIGIIILFKIFSSTLAYIILKMFKWKESKKKIKESAFYKPLKIFFVILGVYLGIHIIKPAAEVMAFVDKVFRICIIILSANGIANLVNPKSSWFMKIKEKANFNKDESVLNFISKIIKTIIYIIAGFIVIIELGYDLNGLIAGLGLGGVVVALAAQDIAKNLFGGFAIIIDKPFNVGDWISTKDLEGAVEDITFRSTKIRTVDDSVVTIPNSTISNDAITNWSRMNKRRLKIVFLLPLEVSEKTLERLTNKIAFVLKSVDHVIENTINIKVDNISEKGIEVLLFLYTDIVPYGDFITFKDTINKEIIKVLESEEIKLAYPGKSLYIKENQIN